MQFRNIKRISALLLSVVALLLCVICVGADYAPDNIIEDGVVSDVPNESAGGAQDGEISDTPETQPPMQSATTAHQSTSELTNDTATAQAGSVGSIIGVIVAVLVAIAVVVIIFIAIPKGGKRV